MNPPTLRRRRPSTSSTRITRSVWACGPPMAPPAHRRWPGEILSCQPASPFTAVSRRVSEPPIPMGRALGVDLHPGDTFAVGREPGRQAT